MSAGDRQTIELPSQASRGVTALALFAVLLVCAIPLFVRLGTRDSTHTMENIALLSSQETWTRMHAGEPGAWLMPTNNGEPRIRKPPLLVWLNLLAWADLDPAMTDPSTLVLRGRLVSASLTLFMIAAIFSLGLTLADLRLAVLASLIAGTTIFLQRQGRTASYDIHMAAWTTGAVAAALWAMRPFREPRLVRPQVIGWALAGALTAASWMSKSPPLTLLLVIGPVVIAMLMDPRRWRSTLAGLAGALAVCGLLVSPWTIYAFTHAANPLAQLAVEFEAARDKPSQFYYYLCVFALVAPWTLWLVSGVIHPFVEEHGAGRRLRLIAWLWFVLILVAFSLHSEAKQQRYILPIVPAAALLAAMVWWDHERLARSGRRDRGAAWLIWPHWTGLSLGSLSLGFLLAKPDVLMAWRLAEEQPFAPFPWPAAALIGAALLTISMLGWRRHLQWRPTAAALATASWAIIAMTALWYANAAAPSRMTLVREDARRVREFVGDAPMRYLVIDPVKDQMPEEEFRFYSGRIIPAVTPKALSELAATPARTGKRAAFVLSTDDPPRREALEAAGFEPAFEVREGLYSTRWLWRLKPSE